MPAIKSEHNLLVYKGSNHLRQRLTLSVLSGKPVRIVEIRSLQDNPGLQEYEVNLIRLLDKLTNGTTVELNETGTTLYFQPGLLQGGPIEHDCSLQRSIGYYLEVLLMVGVFCKNPLNVTLRGVTNDSKDPSVDHIKWSYLPVVKKFILEDEDLDIKIQKRGMLPNGGGEVILKCPVRKQLRPIQLTDFGMVKRVRGTSYALRMSPAIANRMVESSKSVLLNFLPDVYINTDQNKGKNAGKSPGYGLHLVAESTTGIFYSGEQVSNLPSKGEELSVPEDVGVAAAQKLLEQIFLGGCTDSAAQSLAALFIALGPKDVSSIVCGPLTSYTISFLQHLKEFFGVVFKLENYVSETDEEDDVVRGSNKVLMTCVGIGYTNISRRVI